MLKSQSYSSFGRTLPNMARVVHLHAECSHAQVPACKQVNTCLQGIPWLGVVRHEQVRRAVSLFRSTVRFLNGYSLCHTSHFTTSPETSLQQLTLYFSERRSSASNLSLMKSLNISLHLFSSRLATFCSSTPNISCTLFKRVRCSVFFSWLYWRRKDTSSAWFCSPVRNARTEAFALSARLFPDLKHNKNLRTNGAAHLCFSGRMESKNAAAAPPHFDLNCSTFVSH